MQAESNMQKKIVSCAFVALLCLAGCDKRQSSIIVSGMGSVMAQPDTVQMHISLNKTAATTRQAQEEVGLMVRKALKILQDSGVEEKNIQTASLRFMPEYEWRGDGRRLLLGQKAEQTIIFSVGNLDGASGVIDQLIEINGIELQHMQFSVKDNSALYVRSRELAWQKALEKAEQYAKLSGMKIAGTLSISEEGLPVSPVHSQARNMLYAAKAEAAADSSTALPSGEMEITSRVVIEFLLK
jgi:uncharacterized protein YggE